MTQGISVDTSDARAMRDSIATAYAGEMRKAYGERHPDAPTDIHYQFAEAVLTKNGYALEHLANGMNAAAKAAFSAATGVQLPKQQEATWRAIRAWAGISDEADAVTKAQRKVQIELRHLQGQVQNAVEIHQWIKELISKGFNRLMNRDGKWLLVDAKGDGVNLSTRGTGWSKTRALLQAELALQTARAALCSAQHHNAIDAATAHHE